MQDAIVSAVLTYEHFHIVKNDRVGWSGLTQTKKEELVATKHKALEFIDGLINVLNTEFDEHTVTERSKSK